MNYKAMWSGLFVLMLVFSAMSVSAEIPVKTETDETGDVTNTGTALQTTTNDNLDIESMEVMVENGTEGAQYINVSMTLKVDASMEMSEATGDETNDGVDNLSIDEPLVTYTVTVMTLDKIIMATTLNINNNSLMAFYVLNTEDDVPDPSDLGAALGNIFVNWAGDAKNDTEIGEGWIEGDTMFVNIKAGTFNETTALAVTGSTAMVTVAADATGEVKASDSLEYTSESLTNVTAGTHSLTDELGDVVIQDYDYLDLTGFTVTKKDGMYLVNITLDEAPVASNIVVNDGDDVTDLGLIITYTVVLGNDTDALKVSVFPNLGTSGGMVFSANVSMLTLIGDELDTDANATMNETAAGKGEIVGDTIHLELDPAFFGNDDLLVFVQSTVLMNGALVGGDDLGNEMTYNATDFDEPVVVPDDNTTTPDDNTTDDDDDDDEDEDSGFMPGFELVAAIAVLGAVFIVRKRD